ncbi:tetratricopeptide repeat protein [Vibrio sp. TRT 21S02]|uniref:tetratricopeptide repeat protein n=1 Tax=Vibrio sp. TRT 21S02 TaxID=3418507 RepID=UPI003CE98399
MKSKRLKIVFLLLVSIFVGCSNKNISEDYIFSEEFLSSDFLKGYKLWSINRDCGRALPFFQKGVKEKSFFELSNLYSEYCTGGYHFWNSITIGGKRVNGISDDELNWIADKAMIGNPVESFALGQLYLNGYIVGKDIERALHFMTISAKGGYGHAQLQLALVLMEIGEYQNAHLWLKEAASSGQWGAQEMLDGLDAINNTNS